MCSDKIKFVACLIKFRSVQLRQLHERQEVLSAVCVRITVWWDVTLCSFGETCCPYAIESYSCQVNTFCPFRTQFTLRKLSYLNNTIFSDIMSYGNAKFLLNQLDPSSRQKLENVKRGLLRNT